MRDFLVMLLLLRFKVETGLQCVELPRTNFVVLIPFQGHTPVRFGPAIKPHNAGEAADLANLCYASLQTSRVQIKGIE